MPTLTFAQLCKIGKFKKIPCEPIDSGQIQMQVYVYDQFTAIPYCFVKSGNYNMQGMSKAVD